MVLPQDSMIQVKVTPPDETRPMAKLHYQPIGLSDHYEEVCSRRSPFCLDSSEESCSALDIETSDFHYVVDGKTWALLRSHFSDVIPRIIVRGTVFARMLPEQKTQLIEAFQDLNYIVGMCGDGANDCGVTV